MPSNSFSASVDLRMASSNVVFPLATGPRTVATGGPGAGWGAGRGGDAGAAGRVGDTVTLGGANGPAGCRDGRGGGAGAPRSRGRNGTILGSGFLGADGASGATGAAGFGTTGSGGGATNVGSGTISGSGSGMSGGSGATSGAGPAGLGFTIVAAGLTSAGASSSVFAFLDRDAGFWATTSPAAVSSALGLGTRLGLGASGRSRPLPSFTRSAFASALSRGLMARIPLWPISSAATMRSLLVTPSSFASSITLILAAATVPPPPYDLTTISP